jgi:3-oxoacyl-[acyl-carrier protein] reductase
MEAWLQSRVAVVTGGGSGIGRATVLRLTAGGARVVVADVLGQAARTVAHEVSAAAGASHAAAVPGDAAEAVQVDVSRPEDAERLVQTTLDHFGQLDFLVNCAGNAHVGPVVDMPFDAWRSVLDVHLTGMFLCCRAAIDALVASRGRIVSVSSSYGFKGRPNGAHYSAAKAGMVGLTKVLAGELAPHVNVNALAPGPIDTPRWRAGLSDAEYSDKKTQRINDIPLGRMGEPDDIADAVLFLVGPGSRWITGQTLHVNGGEFML